MVKQGLIEAEKAGRLESNVMTKFSAGEAQRIADFLDQYVARLPEGGRVMLDQSVTTELDSGVLHPEEDIDLNYSATRESLEKLRDFCRRADQGFVFG